MRALMAGWKELAEQQADRIDRLEMALQKIVDETSWKSAPIKTPQSTEYIYMIATAALSSPDK